MGMYNIKNKTILKELYVKCKVKCKNKMNTEKNKEKSDYVQLFAAATEPCHE